MAEPGMPLDTTAAEAYEKFLVPTLNRPVAVEVVELAALRAGDQVLDVACGTGIVVRLAAPCVAPGGRVAGLDFDPAMIAVARTVVPEPPGVSVTWHCASAQEMPFESTTFDVAFCLQGLQYFPDCAAGLVEVRRVMKRGGRFLAVVWSLLAECKGQQAIAQALERRKVDVAPIRKAYSMGDSGQLRKLAGDAGFRGVDIRAGSTAARFTSVKQFVDAFAAGSLSSRAAISKVPEHQRSEFYNEVRETLRQYEDKDGVTLPLGYLVLVAHP